MEERAGEAFELGEKLTVIGHKLAPGAMAPAFKLDCLDPADGVLRQVQLADTAGQVRVLNVVNSLDTPVCHTETLRWEQMLAQMPGVVMYTVSMDLPFAQSRWQTSQGVGHRMLSSHRSTQFGEDYGVLIKEWRLLQRAVFVVDGAGRLAHAEYVPDQMAEPDYAAALAAARKAGGNRAG
jgi:thiol peroxidase